MAEETRSCVECFHACLGVDRIYCSLLKSEYQDPVDQGTYCEFYTSILESQEIQ